MNVFISDSTKPPLCYKIKSISKHYQVSKLIYDASAVFLLIDNQ